ncbi:MAG TPA: tetratricopeptide repeat protein [Vicinamibacterales bacterium]|nr:tetratricopeptide repeat protein [Vicinamibacterales bacterium]
MAPRPARASIKQDSGDAVRQQLKRILASVTFRQVDRLKRFLSFVVLEAVDGHGDQLKEYVIGVQVFDKESSFDPRADPIVRVQARRLRARLVRYYKEEGGGDALVIELPKGGYAPVFKHRDPGVGARRSIGATFAGQNTIAVLPFADHSPSGDLIYFCQGLREEIIHNLAKLELLRVLVAPLTDASQDAEPRDSVGNVAMLVAGSVRKAGDRIRVTTHLIDNATGCYLWSESVESDAGDTFALQEAVAHAVVTKLEPRLLDVGQRRGGRRPAENLAARNLYLQGRYHLNQRTDEALHKAVEFFEKAIVEDAQFALAHSGLADAHSLLAHYGVLEPAKVWTKAASGAATAVMLDANSAEAHTSLAHVKATQDWDWSGAEREFQLAIGLDPLYATAHHWHGISCLAPMGRLDEALEELRLAQSLDPVSSIVARDLAMVHVYRRDYDVALEQCDHAIELNPHFSPAYWALGFIQEQRQDLDEAAAAFQRAISLSPHSPRMHAALGRTLALSGKRALALATLRKLDGLAKQRYVSPFEFASIRFALGQTDLGFRWLMKACKDRAFELIALKVDPRFEPLKQDERFERIVREVGLT